LGQLFYIKYTGDPCSTVLKGSAGRFARNWAVRMNTIYLTGACFSACSLRVIDLILYALTNFEEEY